MAIHYKHRSNIYVVLYCCLLFPPIHVWSHEHIHPSQSFSRAYNENGIMYLQALVENLPFNSMYLFESGPIYADIY